MDGNVSSFKDRRVTPDAYQQYSASLSEDKTPLVIDNGSYKCRVGWAGDPRPRMVFRNHIGRQRGKKETDIQIGNDLATLDTSKWLMRSPFDRSVVTQLDVQETLLDHVLERLSINKESIDHPIVITEPLMNPSVSRQNLSQLLFECYHVPGVCYAVDAMCSYHHNNQNKNSSGLVVSVGHHSAQILPVLNGRFQHRNAARLNVGGYEMALFMQKLLHLKYPGHANNLSIYRAEECIHDHCYQALDYASELAMWENVPYYEKNVSKKQLGFSPIPALGITANAQKEKKEKDNKERRILEAKRRHKKLAALYSKLGDLLKNQREETISENRESEVQKEVSDISDAKPIEQATSVPKSAPDDSVIRSLCMTIHKLQDRIDSKYLVKGAINDPVPENEIDEIRTKREEYLKETEEKFTIVNEEKKKSKEADREKLEQERKDDFESWLVGVKQKRRSLASSRDQRRKTVQKRTDWFNIESADLCDSETESDLENEVQFLDGLLKEHAPDVEREIDFVEPASDLAEFYRVHIAVEKIRCPELLYQPSMMGYDQAGLTEAIENVLKKYPVEKQVEMVQYVLLTGSTCRLPKFQERLQAELVSILPYQTKLNMVMAADPSLDAWYGANKLATSGNLTDYMLTKAKYDEMGAEYLQEHFCSNPYFAMPSTMD